MQSTKLHREAMQRARERKKPTRSEPSGAPREMRRKNYKLKKNEEKKKKKKDKIKRKMKDGKKKKITFRGLWSRAEIGAFRELSGLSLPLRFNTPSILMFIPTPTGKNSGGFFPSSSFHSPS